MNTVSDDADLLTRLGQIQRALVAEAHGMARAASALEGLPHGRDLDQALGIVLRAACEHLGFARAYAYVAQDGAMTLRGAWPRGRRTARALEQRVVASGRPQTSRSGKAIAVPLLIGDEAAGGPPPAGALRLERNEARSVVGDCLAPIMRFAEAASLALENALLTERVRAQGSRIEGLRGYLSEANHRIKNNLQALAGFLAAAEGSQQTSGALRASAARIQTIAALHDALARAGDRDLDLADLTRRICADAAALGPTGDRVSVIVSAEPMDAGPPAARAFALILHELVANALKYAYPADELGEVRVALRRIGSRARLEVADDGVGMAGSRPATQGASALSGMGLSLAASIAEHDLGGNLELHSEKGTVGRLEFPLGQRVDMEPADGSDP
jgi:two-component sensor histidine kinase